VEPPRAVAVRGLRTLPRSGWRGDVGAALAVVAGRPGLWLLGMLGFALRGGVLVLALPIVVLPTQVEVRFLLGANLGTSGLTPGFFVLAGVAGAIAALVALLALLVLAVVDVAAFEQLLTSPQLVEQRAWLEPPALGGPVRRGLVRRAYAVQLTVLVALLAAAIPLTMAINAAIIDELLRPTSDASIYGRVLSDVRDPLFLFVAVFLLIELFGAAVERELFMRTAGLRFRTSGQPRPGATFPAIPRTVGRLLRAPVRPVLAAGAGWLMWAVAIPVVIGALVLTWQQVETSFLALPVPGVPELLHDLALFLVAALLSAVFVSGLLVFGVISAVRAALWTLAGLR
jgi:hypothetical protein